MSTAEKYLPASVAAPAESQLGKEYRQPRLCFWVGLLCTVTFTVAAVGSVWAALANPDGSFTRPIEAAIFFGGFWGLVTLLSAYLLWSAVVERVVLWEDRVRVVGLRRTREVRLADVSRAEWSFGLTSGESIVLHGPAGAVTVSFALFEAPTKYAVKDFFRAVVPAGRQSGQEKAARLQTRWAAVIGGTLGAALVGCAVFVDLDPVERWIYIVLGGVVVVVSLGVLLVQLLRRPAPSVQ